MTALAETIRTRAPGSTGWTVDDLYEPELERFWESGSYEIIEGVLTTMAPAYGDGSLPLARLNKAMLFYFEAYQIAGDFMIEPDFVISPMRVVKPDLIFVTADNLKRQQRAHKSSGKKPELKIGRILVPPTLIIESISIGHEMHDQKTKRDWYAGAGVENYWIIDGFRKTLECLVLSRGVYRVDCSGKGKQVLSPSAFDGLKISLESLWV